MKQRPIIEPMGWFYAPKYWKHYDDLHKNITDDKKLAKFYQEIADDWIGESQEEEEPNKNKYLDIFRKVFKKGDSYNPDSLDKQEAIDPKETSKNTIPQGRIFCRLGHCDCVKNQFCEARAKSETSVILYTKSDSKPEYWKERKERSVSLDLGFPSLEACIYVFNIKIVTPIAYITLQMIMSLQYFFAKSTKRVQKNNTCIVRIQPIRIAHAHKKFIKLFISIIFYVFFKNTISIHIQYIALHAKNILQ